MTDNIDSMVEKVLSETSGPEEDFRILHLSNGATVKLTPPPTMAIQSFRQAHTKPRPPMVTITQDGRTWDEANPNDPSYKESVGDYNLESGEAMIRLMLWSSCEIQQLPRGVKLYEEDLDWADEISELLGVEVPTSPRLRKVAWLRYRIFAAPKDFEKMQDVLAQLSGTPEEAIKAAQATFRR